MGTGEQPDQPLELAPNNAARSQSPGSNTGSLRKTTIPSVEHSATLGGDAKKPITPLDRSQDKVYIATTSVVKAVMALSQGVDKANSSENSSEKYLDLVRKVGEELRALLGAVDVMAHRFPSQAHK